MESLPTRLKIQIRDHINAETAPLPTAIATLSSTLGYHVTYDPEWSMLWTSLQPYYPDQATFIPNVAETLATWCTYFTSWLESDENETPVERLLDELKPIGRLRLVLEIESDSKYLRPITRWRQKDKVFVVSFPKAKPSYRQAVYAGFATDFSGLFSTSPSLRPQIEGASAPAPTPDDWSMLDSPEVAPVGSRSLAGRHGNVSSPPRLEDEYLPDMATLERPEALMSRPPYRLVVRQEGMGRVEVQGSHQGSLVLIESYLKRWVRHSTTLVNRPPLVEIRLRESLFGLGLLYDSLSIEATNQRGGGAVTASLVLVVVENVLGYDLVTDRSVSGSVWEFERKRGFK